MANPVQMTVDAFYKQLQALSADAKREQSALEANKQLLTQLYHDARVAGDAARMKALDPIVHQNSVARLKLRDFIAKFNAAANAGGDFLRKAGFNVPALSGIGFVPAAAAIAISVTAVSLLGIAIVALNAVKELRRNLDAATDQYVSVLRDPNATPAQKAEAQRQINELTKNTGLLGGLVPILALVAVIVIAPSLLRRRAA